MTERPGYILRVEDGAVDASRFADAVAEGRRLLESGRAEEAGDKLRRALEMWRGPALAAFEFEDFAVPEINRLNELKLSALEARIAADLDCGRLSVVIPDLERLTEEHPLRERVWGSLMLALYRDGRQADALRAFQVARRRLGEELGIEPSADLIELEDRILRQDPTLEPNSRTLHQRAGNLPIEMTSFVGRDDDVHAIQELVASSRLVTLLGVGGVGKTRLAIWVARTVADRFPDGAWLVDLSSVSDPDHVPALVSSVLGSDPNEDPSQSLRDKDMLLILDNCEAVVDGAAVLAEEVLVGSPAVTIIATSREPLEARGEVLWRLNPLEVPDDSGRMAPAELARVESVRLFTERATAADPSFELGSVRADDVARICRLLEGVPLAIELAAARVRHMTLPEIDAGLDDRFALLVGGTRTMPRRHRALEAAIEWSHEQLDPAERELFDRLGVFSLEFPLAAAEVVCSGDGIGADEIRDLLGHLTDKSLVMREERDGRTWYRLLDTLGQYAFDHIAFRHLHHHARGFVVGIAQRTDPRLRGSEQEMWSVLLSGDREIAGAALEVAANSFREDEGAFLAGVAAARATRSGRIGFLGGMTPDAPDTEIEEDLGWAYPIREIMSRFRNGFRAGATFTDPKVVVDEVYLTESVDMVAAFRSPALGREAATDLYARGADVVLHAASRSGARIFEAARRASEDTGEYRWGIGVDRDEYLIQSDSLRPHVLSSVVKQVPATVYTQIKSAVLSGGDSAAPSFDLANEGVRLATAGEHLDPFWEELAEVREQIIVGSIEVASHGAQ